MERYTRVFSFMFEVFGMAGKNPTLFRPILFNVMLAAPFNIGLAVVYGHIHSQMAGYAVMLAGVAVLYFIDYFCAGLTASLIYDQVTTGNATMSAALERTKKAAPSIMIFAAISALFDFLASIAQERNDIVGKIVSQIVYLVWTTATYVVMPTMVIEGLHFTEAFSRAKALGKNDPTNVGSGIIGIGLVNYIVSGACMFVAYQGSHALAHISPIVGAVFFFTFFNVSWALTGFLKTSYFTCFYLWAKECEKKGSASTSFAPAPLAAALS